MVKSSIAWADSIYMRVFLAICALSLMSGCAIGKPNSALLETSLGPTLDGMWKAHGGMSQWKRFGGVQFAYEAVIRKTPVAIPRILIEFSSPLTIWRKPDPAGPWISGTEDLPVRPDGSLVPAYELSLLSLDCLFHLPFFLDNPGWVLRQAMKVNPADALVEFEASRPGGNQAIGPFLFRFRAEKPPGRLSRAHYFCRHPFPGEGVYRVEFDKYRTFQGILVATERNHYRVSGQGEAPALAAREKPVAPWKESLSEVRFLTKNEVGELLGQPSPAAAKD